MSHFDSRKHCKGRLLTGMVNAKYIMGWSGTLRYQWLFYNTTNADMLAVLINITLTSPPYLLLAIIIVTIVVGVDVIINIIIFIIFVIILIVISIIILIVIISIVIVDFTYLCNIYFYYRILPFFYMSSLS